MPKRDNLARREVQAPLFALVAAPGTGSARIAWLAARAIGVAGASTTTSGFPGCADEAHDAFLAYADAGLTVIAFAHPARSCELATQAQDVTWQDAELRWIETYANALRTVPDDRRFLLPVDRVDKGDWRRVKALVGCLGAAAADGVLDALRGYYVALIRKNDGATIEDVLTSPRLSGEIRLAWLLLQQETDAARPSPELARRLAGLVARMRDRIARARERELATTAAAERAANESTALRAAAAARIDELDGLKQSRWWRLHLGIRPQRDLTGDIPAAYRQLADDGLLFGLRPRGAALALGRGLAPRAYEEYGLTPTVDMDVAAILIALHADLPGTTFTAGLELVAPNATIAGHFVSPALRTEDLAQPVRFATGHLQIKAGEPWRLRIFVRNATGPVRAYEFQRRLPLRRWRVERFAFAGIDLA